MGRRQLGVLLVPLLAIVVSMVAAGIPGSASQTLSVDSFVQYFFGAGNCGGPDCQRLPNGDLLFSEFNGGQATGTFSGDFVEHLNLRLHPDGTSDFTGTATCGGSPFSNGCAVGGETIVINFTLRGRGTWTPANFTQTLQGNWIAAGTTASIASSSRTASNPRTASGPRPTAPTARGAGSFTLTGIHSEEYTGRLELI